MNVLEKLASASGQREQDLNIALAQQIAQTKDKGAVKDLIEGLSHKTKAIRHDCIKTLYELAALQPKLVLPYFDNFINLLQHKDNRMQWGTMTVLSAMTTEAPQQIFDNLNLILMVSDEGSVITRDHVVKILVSLSVDDKYAETTIPLLLEQILKSPFNQLPSYAEQTLTVMNGNYKIQFRKILEERLPEVEPESKKKRVEKILKKI